MAALLTELKYARDKLAHAGFETNDLGLVARAIYGDVQGMARDKMSIELEELGYHWPDDVPNELKRLIRNP